MLTPHAGSRSALRTTHVVTLDPGHWYVQGFTPEDHADLGWASDALGVLVPATSVGPVTVPEGTTYTSDPDEVLRTWWPEDDTGEQAQACEAPDGHPQDPRTCSGLVFWLDNQGSAVCQGHASASREVSAAEMEQAR